MNKDVSPDPARRLQYLLQYTAGEANTLLSSYSLDQTLAGYESAKKELIKSYGNPHIVASAYLKQIEKLNVVNVNDSVALKSLCVFLKKCKDSISTLKHLHQLNTDMYLQK